MEYIIVLIICVITIIVMKFAFGAKKKNLQKIKEIGYRNDLNEMTNAFPENEDVCKEILKQLGNTSVKIEASVNEEKTLSYYSVMSNQIIIANIKDTFTRIQTIAHECMHAMQERKMLLFNFIFSNIYILYFVLIIILTIFKVVEQSMLQVFILTILGIIYYSIRSYLETDAMVKAPYVAEQYMQESQKLSNENIETIMKNYAELNKMGIPMTNFQLIISIIIKIIIYCLIAIIMVM